MSEPYRVLLVGQPNVGKSALFTRMTGVGTISSNYAGTTVEFEESVVVHNGKTIDVRDLPGTYGLSENSLDEKVAVSMLRDEEYDVAVVVADATNLAGSLVLCFEVVELGIPTVLALNKYDAATKKLDFDIPQLERILGIPVIPVSAKTSNGVDLLLDRICEPVGASGFKVGYSEIIEKSVNNISAAVSDKRFSSYGIAVKSLEGNTGFLDSPELEDTVSKMRSILTELNSESPEMTIGRERYALADVISRKITSRNNHVQTFWEKLSDRSIEPLTGIPILAVVMGLMFVSIVYVGSFLDGIVSTAYDFVLGGFLDEWSSGMDPFPKAVIEGINGSIAAILGLVIPYIMVFYLILAVLEDSGYLTRIVVLLDTVMHRLGLHGGAAIPMMVGIGCNVPAILSTRTIRSRRERLIICSLIVMVIPCSAQISIIMGIVGKYAGPAYAFSIVTILFVLGCVIGLTLNKYLPKEPSNLAMELPDLVVPSLKNVLTKTWTRIKDFFLIAFPMLVVGSIVVEILLTYNVLDAIVDPFSFVTVSMLGLPAVCIICFLVGILRKEMAVGMLVILLGEKFYQIMTPEQFMVFGLVMATYVPCIATLSVLGKEMGLKDTVAISGTSCLLALTLGTIANIVLRLT